MGKRTSRTVVLGALATAAALWFGTTMAHAEDVAITVGSASGNDGDVVDIDVTLNSGGNQVSGTQNDITFDANAPIQAKTNNRPDCAVNPDIGKEATSFSFRPSGCTPGSTCTGVRALVLSTSNTDAIPDGSVLYTCKVAIGTSAPNGNYALECSNQGASNPKGAAFNGTDLVCSGDGLTKCNNTDGTPNDAKCMATPVPSGDAPGGTCSVTQPPTTCASGEVVVGGGGPTPTPTTPAPTGPVINVGSASGNDGDVVSFDVTLSTAGAQVSGTQNDITFDANAPIQAKTNNRPDCAVNPDIGKEATSFSFRPSGCTPGSTCTGVRALVLSTSNTDAIPDGSVLYTCMVAIGASAPNGNYPLECSNQGASNPKGAAFNGTDLVCSGDGLTKCNNTDGTPNDAKCMATPVPSGDAPGGTCSVMQPATSCSSGQVTVGGGGEVTPTFTPTTEVTVAVPTSTPTTAVAATQTPTATPVRPTVTPGGVNLDDSDGCQIAMQGGSSRAWLLIIPAVGLLAMRRRRRY